MVLERLLAATGQGGRSRRVLVRHLVRRADAARDDRRFAEAATLYGEAIRLAPERAGLHVQHGHMLKEDGRLDGAERAYEAALALIPDDPDLALQLGHFYKTAGRPLDAIRSYERALALKPDWSDPRRELDNLGQAQAPGGEPLPRSSEDGGHDHVARFAAAGTLTPEQVARLVPDLAPRPHETLLHDHAVGLQVRRLGRPETSIWGNVRTLRGVEALHGFCIAERPIVEVRVLLNGLAIYRGPVRGGYELAHERDKSRVLKYVFNIWLDFGAYKPGRYEVEIRCTDVEQDHHLFHDAVMIAPPVPFAEEEASDAAVPVSDPDPASLAARIRALPSTVRAAERTFLPTPPRNVLLMRTDQLGDVVSSAPSVRRLRALMPEARFVGLLTAANADLARTLGLFDEVVVVDFPDDQVERRRVMPLPAQEELRRRLEPYAFDLAIDLSQSNVSRPLLLLSGAKFLYGVGGGDWPWLTGEFGLNTHDPRNRLDRVPHSAKTLALVETLGALLRDSFEVVRRDDLDRSRLAAFGLAPDDRYVVLHTGARIEFSRWPHFAELAAALRARTDLKVVMITDDPSARAALPAALRDEPGVLLLDQRLSFDDFDAIVSFATSLVGNDSGPKHLASLRGVPAVTLFTARINWMEWGQERGGVIISRRVPCAGCALFHDPEECGQDFTCIRDIAVAEVLDATMRVSDIDGR